MKFPVGQSISCEQSSQVHGGKDGVHCALYKSYFRIKILSTTFVSIVNCLRIDDFFFNMRANLDDKKEDRLGYQIETQSIQDWIQF